MPTVAGLMEWGSSFREIFETPAVREGFISGFAVGFILPVGIILIVWIAIKRRRRCRAIRISGEGGDLVISSVAIREFIQRIAAGFHELELLGVRLQRRRRNTDINIRVNAVPGANIKLLKEALKDQVRSEAAEKMGLDEALGSVHVDVQKYSASERAIAKQARKTGRHTPSESSLSPYDIGEPQNPNAESDAPDRQSEAEAGADSGTSDEDDDTISLR